MLTTRALEAGGLDECGAILIPQEKEKPSFKLMCMPSRKTKKVSLLLKKTSIGRQWRGKSKCCWRREAKPLRVDKCLGLRSARPIDTRAYRRPIDASRATRDSLSLQP